jgi:hypothetical protein
MAQFQELLPIPTARLDVLQAHKHYLKATAIKNKLQLRTGKEKNKIKQNRKMKLNKQQRNSHGSTAAASNSWKNYESKCNIPRCLHLFHR